MKEEGFKIIQGFHKDIEEKLNEWDEEYEVEIIQFNNTSSDFGVVIVKLTIRDYN